MNMKNLSNEKLSKLRKGGVWIPSPLALDKNRKPSEKWQRLLTLYYIRAGATVIVPGAHTGEFSGGDLEIYRYWLTLIKEMVAQDGQFIIASHSPILMAFSGAAIYNFDQGQIQPARFEDLEYVRLMRDFLQNPAAFLHNL